MPLLSRSPITLTATWPFMATQLLPSGRQVHVQWASPSDAPVRTGIKQMCKVQVEQNPQHSRSNLRCDILTPRAPACASSNLKRAYPLLLQHFGRLASQ
jgi:hypothetical protein